VTGIGARAQEAHPAQRAARFLPRIREEMGARRAPPAAHEPRSMPISAPCDGSNSQKKADMYTDRQSGGGVRVSADTERAQGEGEGVGEGWGESEGEGEGEGKGEGAPSRG
jgi:hypothetical protein